MLSPGVDGGSVSGVISPVKCTYFKSHINELNGALGEGGEG